MPPRLAPHYFLRPFIPPRTLLFRDSQILNVRRAFHDAKAHFITLDARGSLATQNIDLFIGEPHEAYIISQKGIGLAMKSAITNQTGMCLASDPEKIPLTFFHDTLHFAHAAVPYPRVVVPQDLPRQNETNRSPATLWLWGASTSITLDGTPDHYFEESSRESHKRLKGAAKLLRDR
ncbi:hypothetical protein ED733_003317 [Metarhizium rileyi]|uniref:Uncharacterized protein n=1 Tax=Metarhizium rileyi (strain RCEF 4871) TaxID=1649241 RepID=A0A5C6G6B0_METRR|nr:hypothetical protein ED733_003317 [Metarhizium rileyi]